MILEPSVSSRREPGRDGRLGPTRNQVETGSGGFGWRTTRRGWRSFWRGNDGVDPILQRQGHRLDDARENDNRLRVDVGLGQNIML